MSTRLIAETISPAAMFWTVLVDDKVRCSGHMRRMPVVPPDPEPEPLDIYASIESLAASFSATVNLLPGDDGARNSTKASAEGWLYNDALSPAETAAIAAARKLP